MSIEVGEWRNGILRWVPLRPVRRRIARFAHMLGLAWRLWHKPWSGRSDPGNPWSCIGLRTALSVARIVWH